MSMNKLPRGLWPVMLNAFHEDGSIDWRGVDALTDWYIERGSAGLFACCGSSEMFHLDDGERLEVTRRVVQRAGGRVPVVATGTFGGPVDGQADFVRRMADTGVDAVVVIVCLLAGRDESEEVLKRNMERLLELTDPVPLGLTNAQRPITGSFRPVFSASSAARTGSSTTRIPPAISIYSGGRSTPYGLRGSVSTTPISRPVSRGCATAPRAFRPLPPTCFPSCFPGCAQNLTDSRKRRRRYNG